MGIRTHWVSPSLADHRPSTPPKPSRGYGRAARCALHSVASLPHCSAYVAVLPVPALALRVHRGPKPHSTASSHLPSRLVRPRCSRLVTLAVHVEASRCARSLATARGGRRARASGVFSHRPGANGPPGDPRVPCAVRAERGPRCGERGAKCPANPGKAGFHQVSRTHSGWTERARRAWRRCRHGIGGRRSRPPGSRRSGAVSATPIRASGARFGGSEASENRDGDRRAKAAVSRRRATDMSPSDRERVEGFRGRVGRVVAKLDRVAVEAVATS